ncbi:MAG TPA: Arc family DNA-binding protein [Acidovorax sp.]|nr:Arc family DNA-binding protein [Acidovorax sp.]
MATDRHQAPSYPLRMPEDLKARVQAAAEASGRSLHAELLQRIQNSFEALPNSGAEESANQQAYQLAQVRAMVGILALLCSANGDMLNMLANAVESPDGVPPDMLESVRRQAAKAKAIPDTLGYDPVKDMAEVRRLEAMLKATDETGSSKSTL